MLSYSAKRFDEICMSETLINSERLIVYAYLSIATPKFTLVKLIIGFEYVNLHYGVQ